MANDKSELTRDVRRSGARWLLVLLSTAFVITFPILLFGFPVGGDDSLTHFNWYKSFSHQLSLGEMYPRWLIEMNADFGSPAFFFYPPVPYYVAAFFNLITGPVTTDEQVWQHLGFAVAAGIIASGAACYWWLRGFVAPKAAAIASIIYLLLPYHITIDLYVRTAFGELWAFVWMPLVLKFVRETGENPIRALTGLALSYALLIMTHLPTTLIFSLIPLAYCFFAGETGKRKSRLKLTIAGMTFGTAIAAVYLLPALSMRNYVSFEAQQTGSLFYENWFLFSLRESGEAGVTVFVVRLTLMLASMIAGLMLCAAIVGKISFLKREWYFWWVVAIVNILMMIPLSKFVWQLIPVIQSVQFPYRFNATLCVAQAALTAIALSKLFSSEEFFVSNWRKFGWRKVALFGTAAALGCLWAGLLIFVLPYKKYSGEDMRLFYTEESIIYTRELKAEVSEYTPKISPLEHKKLLKSLAAEKQISGLSNFTRITGEQSKVEVNQWEARRINLTVEAPEEVTLTVGQFYFPGWTAFANSQSAAELPVRPSAEGLLEIEIPKGNTRLNIILAPLWMERVGWLISFGAIITLSITALFLNYSTRLFKKNFDGRLAN